ncbi:MAG: ABC transporter permease [Planctomycetota bacterium]|nr:ABC transporter permease [Planctomycetota bacterium]
MLHVAMRMLFGDRSKYATLVAGLAFAALLMCQQGAIFLGLLTQATGPLQNIRQPDLWVADPGIQWISEYRALSDEKLARVRSVPGVRWAEPLFNAYAVTELPDNNFKRVQIIGIARTTLVGRPEEMIEGRVENLWQPDAIIVEENSAVLMGGVRMGDVIKINDQRAVVVGIARAKRGFESNGIIYTTFDNAVQFSPTGRETISYVLVKVKDGFDIAEVQSRISALGDVAAFTPGEFRARSTRFIIVATGIGVNFGITITLGFVVGLLLSAAIFYQFTLENLRSFAVLKAMGTSTLRLVGMVLMQALVVGVIGFGIGAGVAGLFTLLSRKADSDLSTYFPWPLLVGSFFATLLTIGVGSLLSIRRVITVSPGTVFSS